MTVSRLTAEGAERASRVASRTAVDTFPTVDGRLADLARLFVSWLETGARPDGMFAEEVFADLSVPQWRVQAQGPDAVFHLREHDHPDHRRGRREQRDEQGIGRSI